MKFFIENRRHTLPISVFLSIVTAFFFRLSGFHPTDTAIDFIFSGKLDVNSYFFYLWKNPYYLTLDFHSIHPDYYLVSFIAKAGVSWLAQILAFTATPVLLFFIVRKNPDYVFPVLAWLATLPIIFLFGYAVSFIWISIFALELILLKNSNIRIGGAILFFSFLYLPTVFITIPYYYFIYGYKNNRQSVITILWSLASILFFHSLLAFILFGAAFKDSIHFVFFHFLGYANYFRTTGEYYMVSLSENLPETIYYIIAFLLVAFSSYKGILHFARKAPLGLALFFAFILIDMFLITRGASALLWIGGAIVLGSVSASFTFDKIKFSKHVLSIMVSMLFVSYYVYAGNLEIEQNKKAPSENWIVSINDLPKFPYGPARVKKIYLMDTKIIPANIVMEKQFHGKNYDTMLSKIAIEFFDAEKQFAEKSLKILSGENFNLYLSSGSHPADEKEPYSRSRILWDSLISDQTFKRAIFMD
ncbi:MAG: hypothetical protein ABUK01_01185 [Leptospirales bacterium]